MWRLWCKSLGSKATDCSKESDQVCLMRSLILFVYLITNIAIVVNIVFHW
jgi:hypothetical protein